MMSSHVAIVTGASQGIGLATVAALAGRGTTVVALARNLPRLEAALDGIEVGDRARRVALACDVADETSVRTAVAEVAARFGRIDVLVNSAGVSMSARTTLGETASADWHRIIDTNLTGTYLMCRECLPLLKAAPQGYILNIQSTGAYRVTPGTSLYAASKFGVRALTEGLIEEHRNSSLRVTSVSPGPVSTSIWDHKLEPPSAERRALMLRPEDIADILAWLVERPPHLHIPNITVTPWTGI